MKIEDTENTPRKDVVSLLGMSDPQFTRFRSLGLFPPNGHGKYNLKAVIRAWGDYLAGKRAGTSLEEERRLLVIAQREQIEQNTAAQRGELVRLSDVQQVLDGVMVLIGTQLDGLSGRVSGELAGIADSAEIRSRLFNETRRIRHAASQKLAAFVIGKERGEDTSATTTEDA